MADLQKTREFRQNVIQLSQLLWYIKGKEKIMAIGEGGPPAGPGIDTSFLYRQQMAQGGGGKGLFAGILPDANITCFKLPAGLFNADGMVNKLPQARPTAFGKCKDSIGLRLPKIAEDLANILKNSNVTFGGSLAAGTPVSSGIAPIDSGGHGISA